MHAFAPVRKRAALAATAALSLSVLAGCKSNEILNVQSPDVLSPSSFTNAAGLDPLRVGVLSDFAYAFDGSSDAFTVATGNMADELYATDTFADRLQINARQSIEVDPAMETEYRNMQQARSGANHAIQLYAKVAATSKWQRAQMYVVRGYTEMFFGEGWCSGTPFSAQDDAGNAIYGQPNTTTQLFTMASADMDSALALTDNSADGVQVKYEAQVGKGRAQLDLGQFAAAAAAVQGVPRTFVFNTNHSTASALHSEQNGMWAAEANGASRYSLIDKEGTNGLPYLSSGDPRLSWSPSTRIGFNAVSQNLPTETKFGRTTPGIVADGTEAQLIAMEAELQVNTQAARDSLFGALNNLRTSSGIKGLNAMAGSSPTTQSAMVDLFFQERAYWTWLTGHRLGDMRRLVRQYGRATESVFPTGELPPPIVGNYGTSTSIVIPFAEHTNPNYNGCLDTKA